MTSTPLGTNTVTQIGLVVHNIEEAAQAWSLLLGVPCPDISNGAGHSGIDRTHR